MNVADYLHDPEEPLCWAFERIPIAKVLECGLHAGARGQQDAQEPLSEILAQISRVREQPRARLQTPPPSYDSGLRSYDYVQTPGHSRDPIAIADVGAEFKQLLPLPGRGVELDLPGLNAGVNICLDGSRPFLMAPSAGRLLRPAPGYLPQRDFKLADQARIAAPERAWPSNRGSAELYDRKRAELPPWKPGKCARDATFEQPCRPARSMRPQARSLPNLVSTSSPLPQNVRGVHVRARPSMMHVGMSVLKR